MGGFSLWKSSASCSNSDADTWENEEALLSVASAFQEESQQSPESRASSLKSREVGLGPQTYI